MALVNGRGTVNGYNIGPKADLQEVELPGADLRGANLFRADLRGADLEGADLSGAILSNANLSDAKLLGAKLHGADLSLAILRDANLFQAKLYKADLEGADLTGADLTGAILRRTYFKDAIVDPEHMKMIKKAHQEELESISVNVARSPNPRSAHRRSNPNSMLQKASHVVFKAYYFAGPSSEDMVKVYEGFSETRAFDAIEKYEKRGLQVEIWQGVEGDSRSDQLYYP